MKWHGIEDKEKSSTVTKECNIQLVVEKYGGWEFSKLTSENSFKFLVELTEARKGVMNPAARSGEESSQEEEEKVSDEEESEEDS